MNVFAVIFWTMLVIDLVVAGMSIALGWYVLMALLAVISS